MYGLALDRRDRARNQRIRLNPLSDAEQHETQDPDHKVWEAPNLESLDVAATEGGAAPKNNENPNFYIG